ncbi:HypC/HybG/HupF family hydrogenase formation chaperone [Haloimpatiens sp. FM7315]|uniref:HypC/HybG/HupF family hydrogenase formation chaperone n=1 Tax=Haloimpatiens sp. FM7315 TaxID=3298609 RepID=UPI0035A27336
MCVAVSGVIKNLYLPFALVDINGVEICVNVDLLENPAKGEYVLVHGGFAIEKINKEYFNYLDNTLKEMLKEDDIYY